jgi:hypothetical protein
MLHAVQNISTAHRMRSSGNGRVPHPAGAQHDGLHKGKHATMQHRQARPER